MNAYMSVHISTLVCMERAEGAFVADETSDELAQQLVSASSSSSLAPGQRNHFSAMTTAANFFGPSVLFSPPQLEQTLLYIKSNNPEDSKLKLAAAGVRRGDKLVKIGDTSVDDMPFTAVMMFWLIHKGYAADTPLTFRRAAAMPAPKQRRSRREEAEELGVGGQEQLARMMEQDAMAAAKSVYSQMFQALRSILKSVSEAHFANVTDALGMDAMVLGGGAPASPAQVIYTCVCARACMHVLRCRLHRVRL